MLPLHKSIVSQLVWLGAVLMVTISGRAGEIGFLEDFALAKDRKQALEQLIPGTEDYYFYHCLHYQQTEQFDKADELLETWAERFSQTARMREIQHRQALLTYRQSPEDTLDYLEDVMDLRFDHQRDQLGNAPNLPNKLDPALISRETLTKQALSRHADLQGFEDRAMDWLVRQKLSGEHRRMLLQRLDRPDHENLVELVAADLNFRHSGGFGSLPIHGRMLLAQLDALLKLKPNLRDSGNFVNIYLTRLQPSPDIDWRHDPEQKLAYLQRLWDFVGTLPPAFNSLKAHVLYHRLDFDRSRGTYNKERFLEYIQLPRNVGYMDAAYMRRPESREHPANLQQDFRQVTLHRPVVGDEELVKDFLAHFFLKESDIQPYAEYLDDTFVSHVLAETKIVNGLGNPEQWAALLPPEKYRQLKERIDLDFAPTNKEQFADDEAVSLDVYVKNVRTLIVKVYEVNTLSWYRENMREVDTDVNLDGLVPNEEQTYQYDEAPVRRVKRHFEFPALKDRGTYVIDFIGNGMSSRALIRKGRLHYILRTSIAGQVFTILNEKNAVVPKAELWLGGHKHTAEKDGTITVPFTNNASMQPMILCDGNFCSLAHFPHLAENYTLQAGFYVDREALLKRKSAQLVIRPQLLLNTTPVPLAILENVRLSITSTDLDGISSTQELRGEAVKLESGKETVIEFAVPERLSQLQFVLHAQVKRLSGGDEEVDLSAARSFQINQIDKTDKVEDVFLAEFGGQYIVELLGRTGEPLADRAVRLDFKHRDFKQIVTTTLQTDRAGRVVLGNLENIQWVKTTSPQGVSATWPLRNDAHTQRSQAHGRAGTPLEVAFMPTGAGLTRSTVSLLELRGGNFYADRFESLKFEDGLLVLTDLPRGDYDLLLKDSGERIHVRLTPGDFTRGFVLGPERHLQVIDPRPLQIASVQSDDKIITVRLKNAGELTRVHVVASRYRAPWSAFQELTTVSRQEPAWLTVPDALAAYVEGRNIGDEYRYIIDRRYAPKFAGNMLERPSLLLNPWAVRTTETDHQIAQGGDDFAPAGEPASGAIHSKPPEPNPSGTNEDFSNLDFLAEQSAVLLNLQPDENGVVTLNRDDLGSHAYVQIVAVDPLNAATRLVSLSEPQRKFRDLRLADSLDLEKHYALQKKVSVLKEGEKFTLTHLETARFEAYDSLDGVFLLFTTLSENPELLKFRFLLDWPGLEPAEKREKYSEYACHELHLFLYKKDPEFFREVVRPYLESKKDKTFLDHWLLDDDLRRYLQPWEYGQLNTVEKILLAQRIQGEQRYTSRHVENLLALQPPDAELRERLFATAIRGTSLRSDGKFEKGRLGLVDEKLFEFEAMDRAEQTEPAAEPNAPAPPAAAMPGAGGFGAPDETKAGSIRRGQEQAKKAPSKPTRSRDRNQDAQRETDRDMDDMNGLFLQGEALGRELERRKSVRQYFRKLDKTKEWIENNYWHLEMAAADPDLITPSDFWSEYAAHDPKQPFYSVHVAQAARNLHEMLLALAVLDLPFKAQEHDIQFAEATMTVVPGSPMIVFHEEVEAAGLADEKTPVLVSQNVFRLDDRYRYENGERSDKYISQEFLIHAVYGCQIVVTNPTSSRQKLRVLVQVPVGAIPVNGSQRLKSVPVDLQPFHTQTVEYFFYFPLPGEFRHYPVHVARDGKTVAHGEPISFHVVAKPSQIDRKSWEFVSQHGSDEEVLTFLEQQNLHRLDLDRIAFRMRDEGFFGKVIELLSRRHAYEDTLWAYGVMHNQLPVIREFLEHSEDFLAECGEYLDSPLVTIDPVLRRTYQHRDYRPLVNARRHQLGAVREILNDRFHEHYHELLEILSYHRELNDEHRMAVTYYLLLQDRVAEALKFFDQVNADALQTRLQYDYFAAYLAMYRRNVDLASAVAKKYQNHPVDRWREAFAAVSQQIDEILGQDVQIVDKESRDQQQTQAAAKDASFDLRLAGDKVTLTYQNLDTVRVNYYLMDVELLFSRSPFVQAGTERFSFIKPNATQTVKLPDGQSQLEFRLPEDLRSRNVLVQIVGGGQTTAKPYYANTLTVTTSENYGQLLVRQSGNGRPEPAVYVKVYARLRDGRVQFFKDGYTDLRGRFDYVSLSTNELDNVDKFALLVLSDEHGAVVREAQPPQR